MSEGTSSNSGETSFWDSLTGAVSDFSMDDFQVLAGTAIEYEKARNSRPEQARQDTVALATTPQTTQPNPNIRPVSAADIRHQAFGPSVPLNVGGVSLDKNILLITGAVLGGILLFKVVK